MTIIKKFKPNEKSNKGFKKYLVLTSVVLFILILAQIWSSNRVIAFGEKYDKLSFLEKSLGMENQILENEIAKYSSLKIIASKSAELGFSPSISIQYIR